MIQDVKALPVSFYFSPDGTTSFFIPKYQREYVWGGKNWDALFNDLEESPSGHFLGSIICVNTQQDGMAGGRLELIDGQLQNDHLDRFGLTVIPRSEFMVRLRQSLRRPTRRGPWT